MILNLNRTDSRVEWTLNKFVNDTKVSSTVDTLQGRDVIQSNLDGLEEWACANTMRYNKTDCKVLNLDWGNLQYQCRLEE